MWPLKLNVISTWLKRPNKVTKLKKVKLSEAYYVRLPNGREGIVTKHYKESHDCYQVFPVTMSTLFTDLDGSFDDAALITRLNQIFEYLEGREEHS
jgi:hypothetical protein